MLNATLRPRLGPEAVRLLQRSRSRPCFAGDWVSAIISPGILRDRRPTPSGSVAHVMIGALFVLFLVWLYGDSTGVRY